MKQDETTDIIEAAHGTVQVNKDYLDRQFELLALFNLQPTSAERYYVTVKSDGTKVLRKRENPISIFADDDGASCIRQVQKTYAERIGLDADHTGRGKFHDAHRLALMESQSCSLEVGEVDAWASF